MLKIGDFSKLSRISIRMLRHYDQIGLLVPACTDTFTNYRYYSESQLPSASRIAALKDMGFGLGAISEIMDSYNDPQALSGFLSIKKRELMEESEDTLRRLRLLDTAIERLRKDGTVMSYDVTLKELPERYVASLRRSIPSYNQEGIMWEQLYRETADQSLLQSDPCYGLAVFHDKGFKEENPDVEIQISVKGKYRDTEHVIFKTVEPIQYASATYQGSYEKLTEVNISVARWLQENQYEMTGPSFSIYHVSPATAKTPDELVTEVCYPVKKK